MAITNFILISITPDRDRTRLPLHRTEAEGTMVAKGTILNGMEAQMDRDNMDMVAETDITGKLTVPVATMDSAKDMVMARAVAINRIEIHPRRAHRAVRGPG